MQDAFEDNVRKLRTLKQVNGILICTTQGHLIKSTFDRPASLSYGKKIYNIINETNKIMNQADGISDFKFNRISSNNTEFLIMNDKEYIMAVIYDKNKK
ncbi:unnamed protein product [Gordionus sp. m RMFG-2023]